MSETPQDLLRMPKGTTPEAGTGAPPRGQPREVQRPPADILKRRFPPDPADHWPRVFPGL